MSRPPQRRPHRCGAADGHNEPLTGSYDSSNIPGWRRRMDQKQYLEKKWLKIKYSNQLTVLVPSLIFTTCMFVRRLHWIRLVQAPAREAPQRLARFRDGRKHCPDTSEDQVTDAEKKQTIAHQLSIPFYSLTQIRWSPYQGVQNFIAKVSIVLACIYFHRSFMPPNWDLWARWAQDS